MKVRKQTLQIAGAVSTMVLGIWIYMIYDHKKKDKLAVALWEELNKIMNPSSIGLTSEVAFNVNYAEETANKIKGVVLLKNDAASNYAKTIKSAWGWVDDDEDKVYNVFRALKDKVQVSQVARAYSANTKVNLIEDLKNRMSNAELSTLLGIVKSLPPYRVISQK